MRMTMRTMVTHSRQHLLIPASVGRLRISPPPIVRRRVRIHHERPDRRHHRNKPGERKIPPRVLGDARGRQVLERVRQHVDEARREDHAGRERLHPEEEVAFRAQRRIPLRRHGEAHAGGAGHQNRGQGR